MPTVLRAGPYRLFFYSSDRVEPVHVHVERDDCVAKFWLVPVRLEWSRGVGRSEISRIEKLMEDNARHLVEAWNDYSPSELIEAVATDVRVDEFGLSVDLENGRTITVPLGWFPRLAHGSSQERSNWRLIGCGDGIHWPDLDEDISVQGLISGRGSAESQTSLARWLQQRNGAQV